MGEFECSQQRRMGVWRKFANALKSKLPVSTGSEKWLTTLYWLGRAKRKRRKKWRGCQVGKISFCTSNSRLFGLIFKGAIIVIPPFRRFSSFFYRFFYRDFSSGCLVWHVKCYWSATLAALTTAGDRKGGNYARKDNILPSIVEARLV